MCISECITACHSMRCLTIDGFLVRNDACEMSTKPFSNSKRCCCRQCSLSGWFARDSRHHWSGPLARQHGTRVSHCWALDKGSSRAHLYIHTIGIQCFVSASTMEFSAPTCLSLLFVSTSTVNNKQSFCFYAPPFSGNLICYQCCVLLRIDGIHIYICLSVCLQLFPPATIA